jgi:hypothetical protein
VWQAFAQSSPKRDGDTRYAFVTYVRAPGANGAKVKKSARSPNSPSRTEKTHPTHLRL